MARVLGRGPMLGGPRLGGGGRRMIWLALSRHRRLLGLALALAAVWVTIRSAAPPPPATRTVTVAARALAAGAQLTRADLRQQAWPVSAAPADLVAPGQAAGRTLAGPIGAGEAVTQSRLLGPGLLAGQPAGTVAVTIRVADQAALEPVHAGDRVDVLATSAASAEAGELAATRVAAAALVLSRPAASDDDGGGSAWPGGSGSATSAGTSGVLVLAVDPATAARLTGAGTSQPLGVVLLGASP